MVKNADDVKDLDNVSFSFIPSLKCNLQCSFCMYCGSPNHSTVLDIEQVREFMKTVDWGKVVGWGMYGGEPSIAIDLYDQFYKLLPGDISSFIITNGSWSTDRGATDKFLQWCAGKFHIIISGTTQHRLYQNKIFIDKLAKEYPDAFTVKGDEEMHPMGRLSKDNWTCTRKCIWHEQPIRLGIFPTGHIILQNCDGVYPVIGHISQDSFDDVFIKGRQVRELGCLIGGLNINNLLIDMGCDISMRNYKV